MSQPDLITIIVALISAAATITTVVISTRATNKEIAHKLEMSQAVTDTKLQALTDEVKRLTTFSQDIPVLQEQIKVINHRLDDLERSRA